MIPGSTHHSNSINGLVIKLLKRNSLVLTFLKYIYRIQIFDHHMLSCFPLIALVCNFTADLRKVLERTTYDAHHIIYRFREYQVFSGNGE